MPIVNVKLMACGWHIGGEPFRGVASLMKHLGNPKTTCKSINGQRAARQEFADAAPPVVHST